MKEFNGKAIYQPKGKAKEYAEWACNFYVGCPNGCSYCFLKKGVWARTLGGDKPKLKSCFENEMYALGIFEKELLKNKAELQRHGLFFSFITDPFLPGTFEITTCAIALCVDYEIPVYVLTKTTWWIDMILARALKSHSVNRKLAIGFTLTGHDELEPGASSNYERRMAMMKLHEAGFKTWASIEPIIDLQSSFREIGLSRKFCDHYKIGLLAGQKVDREELFKFASLVENSILSTNSSTKVYWKDSITRITGPLESGCSVGRDYNIFNA